MYNLMVDVRTAWDGFNTEGLKAVLNVAEGVCIANFDNITDAMSALLTYKNRITRFSWGTTIAETFYLAKQGKMVYMQSYNN